MLHDIRVDHYMAKSPIVLSPEMSSGLVRDVMSAGADTIHPSHSILDAAEMFQQHGRRRLPVVDDLGVVVGQISRRDVLRALDDLAHRQKQSSVATS